MQIYPGREIESLYLAVGRYCSKELVQASFTPVYWADSISNAPHLI